MKLTCYNPMRFLPARTACLLEFHSLNISQLLSLCVLRPIFQFYSIVLHSFSPVTFLTVMKSRLSLLSLIYVMYVCVCARACVHVCVCLLAFTRPISFHILAQLAATFSKPYHLNYKKCKQFTILIGK
jgi:hypothetical protein